MISVAMDVDEAPVVDWLDRRVKSPPPEGVSWPQASFYVRNDWTFSFDPASANLLADLLELYAEMSQDDQDMNRDSIIPTLSLRDKILSAAAE